MSLTPQDIQAKQFHVRFRGFDVEEVDGFLEQVAENVLMIIEENKGLLQKNEALQRDLDELKKDEQSFKNAIMSAQKVADGMLKKSREEADYLLTQTHEEIKKHKDEAIKEITELEYQVDTLRATQGNLQSELRVVINKYLEVIEGSSTVESDSEITTENVDDEPQIVELTSSYPVYEEEDGDDETSADENEESMVTSSGLVNGEVDLSDLYESIDLPSEPMNESDGADEDAAEESVDDGLGGVMDTVEFDTDPSSAGIDLSDTTIPNLDDEIMFTLDDPLDNHDGEKEKS